MNTMHHAAAALLALTTALVGCATEDEAADWTAMSDEAALDEASAAGDDGDGDDDGLAIEAGAQGLRAAPSYFEVRSLGTNKCLDIPWGEARAGLPVNQFTCHGGPAQRFDFQLSGFGTAYRLRNTSSGLCVTPQANGQGGYVLVQTACGGTAQQQFVLDGQASAYAVAQSSLRWVQDPNYCVDVPSGRPTDGLQLQLYRCNGQSNQVFRLTGGY